VTAWDDDKPALALFDFDGTITKRDSLPLFLRFACGTREFALGCCKFAPVFVLYRPLKRISNHDTKSRLFSLFFSGKSELLLREKGKAFSEQIIPKLLRADAMREIDRHKERGHRVIVVSASLEEWVAPWASALGLETLATRLEYHDGTCLGSIAGRNCHGMEKVRRIRSLVGDAGRYVIYAYGDSRGDAEMLAMADKPHFKPFL
jgi:HAD superfamily hydrolase (TIGR01490 family)